MRPILICKCRGCFGIPDAFLECYQVPGRATGLLKREVTPLVVAFGETDLKLNVLELLKVGTGTGKAYLTTISTVSRSHMCTFIDGVNGLQQHKVKLKQLLSSAFHNDINSPKSVPQLDWHRGCLGKSNHP